MLQAEFFLNTKQLNQAQASLSKAVKLDGKNVTALAKLGQVQGTLGKPDEALTYLQRALELAPNDIRLYLSLGAMYESIGNWQQAEATYQKVLTLQPENALAANDLAYIMLEHGGNINVALTLAQTAHKGMPDLPNTADTLGWAYYSNNAYSAAAPLFEEAIKKVSNNQLYRYHLGLTYEKLNNPTRAKAELEKAIHLDPKSSLADQARLALSQFSGG